MFFVVHNTAEALQALKIATIVLSAFVGVGGFTTLFKLVFGFKHKTKEQRWGSVKSIIGDLVLIAIFWFVFLCFGEDIAAMMFK